jgi:hypothetical protein
MKFVIAYQSSLIDNDIDTQIDAGAAISLLVLRDSPRGE